MAELKDVKGIGPKSLALLNKIGINTIEDLVTHYPFRYEVLKRSKLDEIKDHDKIIIDGIIEGQPTIIFINPKSNASIIASIPNPIFVEDVLFTNLYLLVSWNNSSV